MDRLQQLLPATARAADRRSPAGGTLRGRPVKVADGSSAQVPDTPGNQQRFPQPSRQKPGCGFPVVRFVALFSLVSGAILDVVWDSLHHHDLSLFHQLWDDLLLNLARDQVPERPGRREPRAVKRRPKPYPLLTRPRRRYREIVHRNRYRKGMKRNLRALN